MVSVNGSTHDRGTRSIGCRGGRRVERVHRRRTRKIVTPEPTRFFFSSAGTQQMKRGLSKDWLAGMAMLLAAASWGVLATLLGG